jgi:hypothetical protein
MFRLKIAILRPYKEHLLMLLLDCLNINIHVEICVSSPKILCAVVKSPRLAPHNGKLVSIKYVINAWHNKAIKCLRIYIYRSLQYIFIGLVVM